MGLNSCILLTDSARRHPDRPVLRVGDSVVSYGRLDEDSDRAAAALRRLGVAPGRAVALMVPNGVDFVVAYFAALKAGGTVVPLNVLLRATELEHCLRDSGVHVLIAGRAEAAEVAPIANALGIAHVFLTGDGTPGTARAFGELIDGAEPAEPAADTEPGEVAVLLYTSGTTGRAKGARLTHSGMTWIATILATRLLDLGPNDVVYASLPLSHIFGLNAVLGATLLAGGCVVIEQRFDPDEALTLMARRGVSVFPGVPTMAMGLLGAYERNPVELPALRVALLGGQSVPVEVRKSFEMIFDCHTIEAYGTSEAASAIAATPKDAPGKEASVGQPLWGVDIVIVDDNGNRCPAGQAGEILVRSVGMMAGYHNLPGETAEALRAGWFHTGDIGYLDADGDLFVVDRKKDMIIRGGYNVYPREVEEVLYTHPDVLGAAVIGVPHEVHGEEIAAAVQLRPGAPTTTGDIRAYARDRLAAYKYPRIVAFLDDLPTSSTGKLLKRAIDVDELRKLAHQQEER